MKKVSFKEVKKLAQLYIFIKTGRVFWCHVQWAFCYITDDFLASQFDCKKGADAIKKMERESLIGTKERGAEIMSLF